MKTTITLTTLSLLSNLASSHFTLQNPPSRSSNEDLMSQFPCGGGTSVSSKRTPWPISNGTLSLELGHIDTNLEVLIAFGNSPGSAFNTVLRPTFQVTGLGAFCMTGFSLPAGMNITSGSNATIQVQSNGDPDGGLYNCADITFVETLSAGEQGSCSNSSINIGAATVSGHANGTAYGASETTGEQPSGTGSAPTETTSKPGAGNVLRASIGGVVLVLAGMFAVGL